MQNIQDPLSSHNRLGDFFRNDLQTPLRVSALLAALAALLLTAYPHPAAAQSAQEIARKVMENELQADFSDNSQWMYRDAYKSPDKNTVKIVIETPQASLSEIVEDQGHPPSAQEHQADLAHQQQLVSDPSLRQRQRRNNQHDAQQARDMMKMLPTAFLWQITSRENGEITLAYHPNPSFSPPSMSARVLAAMSGTMVVDEHAIRLKALTGKLVHPVDFAWGLLGHINAGGTFQIVRAEVGPGIWRTTQTHVHISGHALFFKTIGDQEDEVSSDYHPVPKDIDLSRALHMLKDGQVAHELHLEPHFG